MVDKVVDINESKTLSKIKLHVDFIYGISWGNKPQENAYLMLLLLHHAYKACSDNGLFLLAVLQLTNNLYELQIYRIRFCVNIMV